MRTFFGEYPYTLDDKGRVVLPPRHREALGEVVMLTRGMDGQINIYPPEAWEAATEALGAQNQAHSAMRDLSRTLLAASECPVDRQGRIVIPTALRKYADLDSEVVVIGVKDHMEIWPPDKWEAITNRIQTDGRRLSEELARLGLNLKL